MLLQVETKDALNWAFSQPLTIVILLLVIIGMFWYFRKENKEQREEFKKEIQEDRIEFNIKIDKLHQEHKQEKEIIKRDADNRERELKDSLQKSNDFWQNECTRRDVLLNEAMTSLIDLNKLTNETWHANTQAMNKLTDKLEYIIPKK